MHRWTHKAAGGTIQRLNPGLATVRSRSRNDNRLIGRVPIPVLRRLLRTRTAGDRLFGGMRVKLAHPQRFGNANSVLPADQPSLMMAGALFLIVRQIF